MKQIPDGAVDLVITSPPYNLKNSTGNGMKDGRGENGKTPPFKRAILITTTACPTKNTLLGKEIV